VGNPDDSIENVDQFCQRRPDEATAHSFPQPIGVIYDRSNSDRANFGKQARTDDYHLLQWLVGYVRANPSQWVGMIAAISQQVTALNKRKATMSAASREKWQVRGPLSRLRIADFIFLSLLLSSVFGLQLGINNDQITQRLRRREKISLRGIS